MPSPLVSLRVPHVARLGALLLLVTGCGAPNADRPAQYAETRASRSASDMTASNGERLLDPAQPAMRTRLLQRYGPQPSDGWFFTRIRDVAVDVRGQVYVLDDMEQRIRVFAPDGDLLRSMGRLGSGPGEFRRARWLRVLGDTLWVYDPMNARLTAFSTADGALRENTRAGATPMRLDDISPVGHFETSLSHEDRPSVFNPLAVRVSHATGSRGERRELLRYTRSKASLSYYVYPRGEPPAASARLGQMHTRQPFDTEPLWRVGYGGRSLVVVLREEERSGSAMNPFGAGGGPRSIRLLSLGFSGDTLLDQRLISPATPVTDAHVRAIVDSMAHPPDALRLEGKRLAGDPNEIRDSLYVPRVWPAVTELFVGDDGTYWLRQPQPPAPFATFWRFTHSGEPLLPVRIPAGLTLFRVTATHLWAVREDDDGVPVVEMHEVAPSP